MNISGLLVSGTCSIDNPKDWHITFARNREYLKRVDGSSLNLTVLVPPGIDRSGLNLKKILLIEEEFPEYEFARFHNSFNQHQGAEKDVYGRDGVIHPTVVICEGIREVNGPNGLPKIHLKHMGNVIIGNDVRVGPMTFIERACFDSTVIKDGVRIDALCGIGNNVVFGKNTVLASGVGIGGSAVIGENCWIGANSYIRNGIKICPNVVIGCVSAVVKDITEPGIYAGTPAVFKKPYKEGYNF